ncbi:MAG: hypothetical protein WBN72_12095 [Nitrososphaeraceae archaeon]
MPTFNLQRLIVTMKYSMKTSEMILSVLILTAWKDISYYSLSRAFDFITEFRRVSEQSLKLLHYQNLERLGKNPQKNC